VEVENERGLCTESCGTTLGDAAMHVTITKEEELFRDREKLIPLRSKNLKNY